MQIGVLGINHKLAGLYLREELAKVCQKRFGVLQAIQEYHSFVLVSTCNRTEIYFSSNDLPATHTYLLAVLRGEIQEEFEHKLYSYFGIDCFNHLTRVSLGLDSAIIAETEVQGQVKVAYENTIKCHTLCKDLHFLFQKSLSIAKRIRTTLDLGRGMPNIEHAILQKGMHIFPSLENTPLLFIGASEINLKIIAFLKTKKLKNITLCNRSDQLGKELAAAYDIHYLDWQHLPFWHEFDWIILGTKSQSHLITQKDKPKTLTKQKLLMDLSVPRNVDPQLRDPHILLLNIDQINQFLKVRRSRMNHTLAAAEEHVANATQRHTVNYLAKKEYKAALLVG